MSKRAAVTIIALFAAAAALISLGLRQLDPELGWWM